MKYLKISLILTCICLICALGVAGVNYITAPIIEENQTKAKLESYQTIFPDMSFENSEIIVDGFKSSSVKERVNVKDANGEDLGTAFALTGQNTYGKISLTAGMDAEGKLIDVVITENGQTGGRNTMIAEYVDGYTSGMTAEDVANRPVYAGATYASNTVKSLLAAAFAELGIMSDIQKTLVGIFGETVDMGKSVEDDTFIYPQQINLGYTVKDANDSLLGYYYEVNGTNQYGNIKLGIALNPDYSLKNLETFELNQTGGRGESVTEFINTIEVGSNYDAINNLDVVSKATYGCNTVKNAIMIAMAEAQNKFDEALAIRTMFPTYTRTEEKEATVKNVDKYLTVYANGRNGETEVGSVVVSNGENNYGNIKLFVGISSSDTLSSVFIMEANQTGGRNKSLSDFIGGKITSGMTGEEMLGADVVADATFASNTAKEIIANAFEQVTGTRPQLGYDEQYKSMFEGVDLTKSKDFNLEGLDSQFTEGKELYNSDGTLLGYAFVLTSTANDLGGTLTLMVGVQTNGKLQKVIMLANNQTGGFGSHLDGYEDKFTPGMSATDVDGVANTGATLGSEQFKALIKLALGAVKTYDDFYAQAFEGVDLTKSKAITSFANKQIIEGNELYNEKGELLGKAYIIRLENAYGYNVMLVSVKADGTLGKLIDVENNHADLNKVAGFFPEGTTLDKISECVDNNWGTEAGGSYTVEIAALGIKIALSEASTGINDDVRYEALAKEIFPYMVMKHSTVLDKFTNSSYTYGDNVKANIVYGIKVNGTKNYVDASEIGYAYVIELTNGDINILVMIGVDTEGKIVNSKLLSYETINYVDQTAFKDSLQGKVEAYLTQFNGLTLGQVYGLAEADTAYYASRLVKLGFILALNEANNAKVSGYDVWSDEEAYRLGFYNVNLLKSKLVQTTNPNIKSALEAYDSNGTKLGYIYIVDLLGVYSHNYVMVVLSEDGKKLVKLVDLENNHGALSSVSSLFPAGLTLSKVESISYDAITDASYTIEQAKLAIKIAMIDKAASDNSSVIYEAAAKEIFPFMVTGRSQDVANITDSSITYGLKVYGVSGYAPGQFLGYVYVVGVNSLKVMVGVDTDGNYYGYEVLEGSTEAITSFFNAVEVGTTLEAANDLTGDADAKNALIKVLTEAQLHLNLTPYDDQISMAFEDYDIKKSTLITSFVNKDVVTGVVVKNNGGTSLGKAYVIRLENAYGYNVMLVALDNDNKFVKLIDIENNHANLNDVAGEFTVGGDFNQIASDALDSTAGGSFTIEVARLGIQIAMSESVADLQKEVIYESAAKKVFPYMVMKHSSKIDNFSNEQIIFGYNVYGTLNFQDNQYIGKAYVVTGTNRFGSITLMVGVDATGKLVKVSVIEIKQTGGRDQMLDGYEDNFTAGMDSSAVDGVDVVSNATYGSNLIKDLIKIALAEGGNQ